MGGIVSSSTKPYMRLAKTSGGGGLGGGGLLAGGLIGSLAPAIFKSIIGAVQASRGRKELNELLQNRPKYNIPEEYAKALGIYSNLATGDMPGLKRSEQLIGESTARTMAGAERGAISSTAYQGAVSSAQDKELQAIQNLAQMNAQYKTGALQGLAGAYGTMGEQKKEAFEYNLNQPWQIKATMAGEKMGVAQEAVYGGLGDVARTVQSFVGTAYYNKILEDLQKNKG